ncbi:MAG TPA: spermidine synthase [Actinoplanes sp.]|nr:spermidine synthase [Actinoplanes sp.]
MSLRFEELAWSQTPIGAISLRRRFDPRFQVDVYEVKIDDEYLMSSLFTVAEIELARLALAAVSGDRLDVVVGGLGLGYTARAVLEDPRVASMIVIDALAEVIDWHERDLLPSAAALTRDPRSRLVCGDFFAMAAATGGAAGPFGQAAGGFDPATPGRRFDAVLLDVDHSPRQVLHPANAALYTVDGMRRLAAQLRTGGVFALWSNDPPDDDFIAVLRQVFTDVTAHVVSFANPLQERDSANTVYVAR